MKYGKWEGFMGNVGVVIKCPHCQERVEVPDEVWSKKDKIISYMCVACGKVIRG